MASKNLDLAGEVIKHDSCPDVATALRQGIARIISDWEVAVRDSLAGARRLASRGVQDHLPAILAEIADVLEAPTREKISQLLKLSPEHGLNRFDQHFDVRELLDEEVLLRPLILRSTQEGLHRRITQAENVLLNLVIDVTIHGAALAFLARQSKQLRTQAETELKRLSFLSHDLNNNLSAVVLHLRLLRDRLLQVPGFAAELSALDLAQHCITRTTEGMRRLLVHERLRKERPKLQLRSVNLHELAASVADHYGGYAKTKRLDVSVQVPGDAIIYSDYELITLVLQNLVHNALKYGTPGIVSILGRRSGQGNQEQWVLSVRDEGPGIPLKLRGRIFDAFGRGDAQSQEGVGLGLAIASEAADLLGAHLTVESRVGAGSTFNLVLPPVTA